MSEINVSEARKNFRNKKHALVSPFPFEKKPLITVTTLELELELNISLEFCSLESIPSLATLEALVSQNLITN